MTKLPETQLPHPRALAFLGDAVYEIFIRRLAVQAGYSQSKALHEYTTQFANATSQANFLALLMPHLSEEEMTVVRQSRNIGVNASRRKNQAKHRQATSFEALLGALYLQNPERLQTIQTVLLTHIQEHFNSNQVIE